MRFSIGDNGRTITIGHNFPTFVVAEISCNHLGNQALAIELIRHAAQAGANAVKFQLYDPDEMCPPLAEQADTSHYTIHGGMWTGKNLRDMYEAYATPQHWVPDLFAEVRRFQMVPFASVFGARSLAVAVLNEAPLLKIAHPEVTDVALLRAVARHQKPTLLSVNEATSRDTWVKATTAIREHTLAPIVTLYTGDGYPAPPALHLVNREGLKGTSDHSASGAGLLVSVALAVAAGAVMIERHICGFTHDVPDGPFSSNPREFAEMVGTIREAEDLTDPPIPEEPDPPESVQWMRRLVYRRSLLPGHQLDAADVRTARCNAPGALFCDAMEVVGRRTGRPVRSGAPVRGRDFEG